MIKQITCTFLGCIDSIPIPVGLPACNSAQGHFGMYFGFERLMLVLFENASIQMKNDTLKEILHSLSGLLILAVDCESVDS